MNINLPKSLAEEFQNRWQAFQTAAEAADIPAPANPEILNSMEPVFAFSEFVSNSCTREPAILADLVESGDLNRKFKPAGYQQKFKELTANVKNEQALIRLLRRCRRRELVRIAWRDLAGWADLRETMTDLSAFADACLDQTLTILYQWQCAASGVPTAADGSQQHPVVLGLGKLGARELNFSSDVDLIFTYPKAGQTRGTGSSVSNEDFFSRLCRRLIKVIGQLTADGFVFRVDLRLRPFGESGPLVMDFNAMEHYYQEQGREWERYALIKARTVAGDKTAGACLLEQLHPFIYRRYLDYGAFESLREMKQMIALEVKRKAMANDIKLGPGGIREIEFFGQIFQLIRGGVIPSLQQTGILNALKVLADEQHIPRAVCDELTEAYIFLRRTENRLQEYADQQTHRLPTDKIGQLRLAASMGFDTVDAFDSALKNHRKSVHGHFQMLLASSDSPDRQNKIEDRLDGIWQNLMDDRRAQNILAELGYDQPGEVLKLLGHLKNDPETRALSPRGRRRLDKLIPRFLKEISACENPLVTLRRIVDLIKTIERRSSYLALLLENPTALSHLVKLSNASPWIASFLARHPVLLDELLDARTLYLPPEHSEMKIGLRRRLDLVAPDD
ncbi:MAG: bifunctional [glutamate--ammonia ligase]-adenylyl-L-tyrosine phosphorylase/[glutamate--ammonia-ligase] adenylyltransferase, partial [Desulfobacterales bacterium]